MKFSLAKNRTALLGLPMFVVAVVLVCVSGCQRKSKQVSTLNEPQASKHDQADPPIMQPTGTGTATVEFLNLPDKQTVALYRIQANTVVEIQKLTEQTLELPSGFYMASMENGRTKFPVPALAPFLDSKLTIPLNAFPPSDKDWCWIPAGPTIMGDTLGVGREDERPARIVDVDGFWLAKFEVTNRQYAEFLTACSSVGKTIQENWIDLRSRKCHVKQNKSGGFESDAGDFPVVMVSLAGAQAYCQWLSESYKKTYRLPTESEWEKAARGPELFVYSYGNIYKQSNANQESGKLKPVGTYQPNSYGLFDMTGNAFEWMSDVADPSKKETTLNHSLRGGSFVLDGMYLRNSFRMRQSPSVMTDDIGFRVVREKSSN